MRGDGADERGGGNPAHALSSPADTQPGHHTSLVHTHLALAPAPAPSLRVGPLLLAPAEAAALLGPPSPLLWSSLSSSSSIMAVSAAPTETCSLATPSPWHSASQRARTALYRAVAYGRRGWPGPGRGRGREARARIQYSRCP